MPVQVRNPALQVYIAGQRVNYILSASVNRGLDQEMAQGTIVVPYPLPPFVKQWSYCTIQMGGDAPTAYVRLAGYVRDFDYEMWPGAVTIQVSDPLILCKYYWPNQEIDFRGMTDDEIVRITLITAGIPPETIAPLHGTGKVIAQADDPIPLIWPAKQSALELIKEIDSMSPGFRTFCDPDGTIKRQYFDTIPSAVITHHTFTEGVDMFTSTTSVAVREPTTEATVEGDNLSATVTAVSQAASFRRVPAPPVVLPLLREQSLSPTQLSAEEVAAYIVQQGNRNIVKISWSTHRDNVIALGQTVVVDSLHAASNNKFWVQSIQTDIDENGAFTQQGSGVSELSLGTRLHPHHRRLHPRHLHRRESPQTSSSQWWTSRRSKARADQSNCSLLPVRTRRPQQ
jgi:hypothetical protein